jgi:hypothetical protein
MRARPREVNIFNMSLLDILCGALGAFCFMMLVALPFYVSGTGESARSQQRTQELLKDIEKLRERMSDPAQAEELRRMIDDLTAQIKQLEGQLNQYAYEKEQLTKENDELKKVTAELVATNKKQRTQIAQRKPTAVLVTATDEDQQVDMYLEDDLTPEGGGKSANPPFDPAKSWHQSNWSNDITNVTDPDRGYRVWITSQTVAGGNYRLFVKEASEPDRRRTTGFGVLVFGDFPKARLAQVAEIVLGPQRPWDFVGTLSVDDKWEISFKEASQAERDAEWRKRNLSPPPVPTEPPVKRTTVPTATPTAAATPIDRAAMDAQRKRMLEMRKKAEEEQRRKEQQQSGGNTPSPSPSPQATESSQRPRTREEFEQLLKRQQSQQSPGPSTAPAATPPR